MTTLTVQAVTSLSIAANPAIAAAGAPQGIPQTFTATLTNSLTPSGTVIFYDGTAAISGSIALSSGVASYTTSTLAVGAHTISAKFSGDTLNTTSTSGTLSFSVISSLKPGFHDPGLRKPDRCYRQAGLLQHDNSHHHTRPVLRRHLDPHLPYGSVARNVLFEPHQPRLRPHNLRIALHNGHPECRSRKRSAPAFRQGKKVR